MEEQKRDLEFGGINTMEYWENRFSTGDWEKYDGGGQSAFFSRILLNALPDWLKRALNRNHWTVSDWGCAEGSGTAVLAREFPSGRFIGLDFSPSAVEKGRAQFPMCEFEIGDLLGEIRESDVILSSNTLEHCKDPGIILEKLVLASKEHAILMLPLHDRFDISEHFHCFSEDFFPLRIGTHTLSYFRIIDCDGAPLWPGEQLLLIYSAETALEPERRLSDLFSNEEYQRLKKSFLDYRAERKLEQEAAQARDSQAATELENQRAWAEKLTIELRTTQDALQMVNEKKIAIEQILNQTQTDLEAIKEQFSNEINEKKREIVALQEENSVIQQEQKKLIEQAEQAAAVLRAQVNQANAEIAMLHAQVDQATTETAALRAQVDQTAADRTALQVRLRANDERIANALFQLRAMTESGLFKLVHFLNRLKKQAFAREREERKNFRRWLFSRFRHVPDRDHRYNPLFSVINLLDNPAQVFPAAEDLVLNREGELAEHLRTQAAIMEAALTGTLTEEAQKLKNVLSQRKYKGILIYPHIVFWEPLQTPQQLLRAFAQEGWLCFFCESPILQDVCREEEPNLFITYERDILQAIGNTPVTVLLTWMGSRAFVDHIPNKKIWYHILDHLEIFAYYDELYLELHRQVLTTSTIVSYVAAPLQEWVGDRLDAIYLPNGVNVAEISNIHEGFVPDDMAPIVSTGHKIIGYYGYLAEWMDYAMVRQMALLRPEWEFVFVGKAIHDVSLIEDLPNVHLLGLKPYKELSDYAKFFDVATIPFLVDEKMDCVSPIKFYEYLALGKPVVSSYMKELEYYALVWKFISCANNMDEFLHCLNAAMAPDVQSAAQKDGPLLAMQNSWVARVQRLEGLLLRNRAGLLMQTYTKADVVILSIIDYDFRHQRPQHFAQRLAQSGHRVYYVNANFTAEYTETMLEKNLWQVVLPGVERGAIHLTDWADQLQKLTVALDRLIEQNSIRDAVVIVDYPNWVHGALYLRKKYGFCMVTDYMDDFTGFLNPAEALVRENCQLLLGESDGVMASSQFLYDIAAKYNSRVVMNRNGTEFAYFHQAYRPSIRKDKQVIGYYGAIAEWFNVDVVCRCAERFPNCEIVLVGNITAHRKRLDQHPNIRLIGEVPYAKLLPWLESFDVCLIPFDTSTDLIKATNPVKFYEYLSAGKKVVATEIPELEPYSNQFVYLKNDPDEFCEAVKKCLDGTDTLASAEKCFAFAKENDWDERTRVFEEEILTVYPKISVVVLCYNQLDYTKQCVDSILNTTAYPNYELVLVDNCSTDETASYLKEVEAAHAHVKIVLNKTNRGFAGGNNDGIAVSDGEYLVLLNNDTIVTRGWLTGLLKHFRNDASTGLVGPVTNSIGNEAKINAPYLSVQEMPAFADDYTFRHMGEEYPHHGILAMFCLMISRELYEKVGPLDERYGIGMFEDDDYSTASKQAGYQNVLAEDVFIHHFGSASFKKLEDAKHMELHQKNRRYFEKKWGVKWTQPQFRPGVQ